MAHVTLRCLIQPSGLDICEAVKASVTIFRLGRSMSGQTRLLSIIVGAIAVGAALIWQATMSTASVILTPSEIINLKEERRVRIRMGGKVAAEGLSYEVAPSFVLSFRLADRDASDKSIPVIYRNIKPDMFAPGRDVLIDGDWKDGTFHATSLLTQCPSKYEPSVATPD